MNEETNPTGMPEVKTLTDCMPQDMPASGTPDMTDCMPEDMPM